LLKDPLEIILSDRSPDMCLKDGRSESHFVLALITLDVMHPESPVMSACSDEHIEEDKISFRETNPILKGFKSRKWDFIYDT